MMSNNGILLSLSRRFCENMRYTPLWQKTTLIVILIILCITAGFLLGHGSRIFSGAETEQKLPPLPPMPEIEPIEEEEEQVTVTVHYTSTGRRYYLLPDGRKVYEKDYRQKTKKKSGKRKRNPDEGTEK